MAATAMTAISEALSVAGRLRAINKKIGDAEFSALLADLQLELSEAKARIADLLIENSDLRTQLSDGQKAAAIAVQMTFDGQVYRKESDPSAYCPTCFDSDGKAIRLNALAPPLNQVAEYSCGKCGSAISRSRIGWR